MRYGTSYKQNSIDGTFDAIVIGSGIGGLTTAAMMSRFRGMRVLVLERHYTAGGFTHTFQRPGYEWDVGVHYIGEMGPRALMGKVLDAVTDGKLEWADMGDVYDTIVIDTDRYELCKGQENLQRQLHRYFPRDKPAIDGYFKQVRSTLRRSQAYFAEKALPEFLAAVAGPALRWPLLRDSRRTTMEVLRSLTRNTRLIGVLTGQWGDYGLPPSQSSFFIHAAVANHYFEGAAYPVGGSARIAATMLPVIAEGGGVVMTSAEVEQILIESDRAVGVRLADGSEVRAPLVISDAGVALTYGKLVPEEQRRRHGLRPGLPEGPASVGHVSLYLGLEQTAGELGLKKSNVWQYPSDDHDRNVAAFIADRNAPLPLTYLSFPSAKDPDFANRYPGKATIEALTLAPYEWFEQWKNTKWKKRGAGYEALKAQLTERLLQQLYKECPQVEGKIDHMELSTPLTTQNFCAHPRGEIYGLAHTPARFDARWLKPRTPIRGLFLTGADVCSAGVGGALFGGVLTTSAILGKNMIGAAIKYRRGRAP